MKGEVMDAQTPTAKKFAQLTRRLLQYRFILMALVMAMAGFLLIVFRDQFPHSEYWRDFGIAILTAGTIGLVVELYTRRQFETLIADRILEAIETSSLTRGLDDLKLVLSLRNELTSLGLRKIHKERSKIDFASFLDEAEPKSEIRLLGVSLMSFASDRMRDQIQKKLDEGCAIKLLILDSESAFVQRRAVEEGRGYEDIHDDIEAFDKLHRKFIRDVVREPLRKNIELGHYDSAPTYMIVSTNRAMIVGFYLREGRGGLFPHLELEAKEGGIYISFLRHFDSLWAARKERVVEGGEPMKLRRSAGLHSN
jgi:hypothetical protein